MTETSEFTTGDGCRIAYRLDGDSDAPVLVLSNSIATDLRMWDGPVMTDLARHHRVLRYDTRGHGRSDAPAGAYSLDRLGRDVLELMDALRIDRAHVCGLSLGGFVGQWLGIHAPDRIDRLILSNTSAYLGPAPQWDQRIRETLAAPDLSAIADMFLGNWFPPEMFATDPGRIALFRSMILATSPQGLAGCFAVVRDFDVRRTIALIDRPTLVIGGRNDKVTLASHAESIAATIPGAQLCLLPTVHMPNVERPNDFKDVVLRFLNG